VSNHDAFDDVGVFHGDDDENGRALFTLGRGLAARVARVVTAPLVRTVATIGRQTDSNSPSNTKPAPHTRRRLRWIVIVRNNSLGPSSQLPPRPLRAW